MAKNGWKLGKVAILPPGAPGRFWPKTGESGCWRFAACSGLPLTGGCSEGLGAFRFFFKKARIYFFLLLFIHQFKLFFTFVSRPVDSTRPDHFFFTSGNAP